MAPRKDGIAAVGLIGVSMKERLEGKVRFVPQMRSLPIGGLAINLSSFPRKIFPPALLCQKDS